MSRGRDGSHRLQGERQGLLLLTHLCLDTHRKWEPGGHPNSKHTLPPLPPMTCMMGAGKAVHPPSSHPCRVRAALLPCSQPVPLAPGQQWLPSLPDLCLSPACFSLHSLAVFVRRSPPDPSQQRRAGGRVTACQGGQCKAVARASGSSGKGENLFEGKLHPREGIRRSVWGGGISEAVILTCIQPWQGEVKHPVLGRDVARPCPQQGHRQHIPDAAALLWEG